MWVLNEWMVCLFAGINKYNAGTSILKRERKNIYSISYKLLINTELAVCTGELEVNNYKRNIMCAFK